MEDDTVPIVNSFCGDQGDPEESKNVDEIISAIGGFGRYQLCLLVVSMLFSLSISYQTLSMYYAADDPPWKCINPKASLFCSKNLNVSIPESSGDFEQRCKLNRTDWIYTTSRNYSIVTEYDLVCKKEYLKALLTSTFFIGCAVGGIIAGPLTDIYGRKIGIRLAFLLYVFASVTASFITAVWQMLLLRTLIGICFGAAVIVIYIYLCENIPPKSRGTTCNVYFMAFTISVLLLTVIAYFVNAWRYTLMYYSFTSVLSLLLSIPLMESPNWLHAKNRSEEAMNVLRKIAKINKRNIGNFNLKKSNTGEETRKKYSYIDLFNNLKVCIAVIAQCILWFSVGLMFYGIALESSNLGGNIYFNFVLSSLADVPGYVIVILTSVYVKRKVCIGSSFIISSGLILAIAFIPENYTAARVTLAVCSRITLTVCFNSIFLWSFEIFPTVLRSQGMNVCQICSRAGSAAAPFITDVLKSVSFSLPFFIMAGVGVISGLCTLILPETFKKPLRQDYKDMIVEPVTANLPISEDNADSDSN